MDRGFAHMIDIWGADHHGYVPRMKAAFTALPPHDPDKLELIIGQLVNLLESGEARRMSKRKGDIVTVDDLIDAIGVDAARFLLVGRSHDTTLELDIDLAVQQSNNNPVYYVQYAHARICSILRNLPDGGEPPAGAALPAVEVTAHERSLLRALARFPDVLLSAADHARRTACTGTSGSSRPSSTCSTGTAACSATTPTSRPSAPACAQPVRSTLAAGLGLLGVSAPESM